MMGYFRQPEKHFFSKDDLSHLGIIVLSLPGVDTLLTDEGPFRPHSTFGSNIPVETKYEFPDRPEEEIKSMSGPLACLGRISKDMFMDEFESKGFGEYHFFPWGPIWYHFSRPQKKLIQHTDHTVVGQQVLSLVSWMGFMLPQLMNLLGICTLPNGPI